MDQHLHLVAMFTNYKWKDQNQQLNDPDNKYCMCLIYATETHRCATLLHMFLNDWAFVLKKL